MDLYLKDEQQEETLLQMSTHCTLSEYLSGYKYNLTYTTNLNITNIQTQSLCEERSDSLAFASGKFTDFHYFLVKYVCPFVILSKA